MSRAIAFPKHRVKGESFKLSLCNDGNNTTTLQSRVKVPTCISWSWCFVSAQIVMGPAFSRATWINRWNSVMEVEDLSHVFQTITSSRFYSLSNVWINRPLMPYSDVKCYSFALIHAKTKTRFSSGKPKNIVYVYIYTYMIQNCVASCDHNLSLIFKLSTACSTLNRLCNSRIKLGHNHALK